MFMLECEGKALLRQSGIRVPRGAVVERAEDALARAEAASLAPPIAVKAQVRAGRRGKEGGVVRAEGLAETEAIVRFMLGRRFAGERACSVLLEPWSAVERELYLSVTVEGETEGHAVLYAPDGGIEIDPARHRSATASAPSQISAPGACAPRSSRWRRTCGCARR